MCLTWHRKWTVFEGNYWHDVFWGIDLKTREGENHLGIILMELRKELTAMGLPAGSEGQFVCAYGPTRGILVTDEDLTQIDVDCIVNAANKTLLGGSGVDGAIHREAGPELREECQAFGGCQTSETKLTKGYRFPARYVIHTVDPVYGRDDEPLLETCYRNCMELARETGIRSIAFPAISMGKFCQRIYQELTGPNSAGSPFLEKYVDKMAKTLQHFVYHGEGDAWVYTQMVCEQLALFCRRPDTFSARHRCGQYSAYSRSSGIRV